MADLRTVKISEIRENPVALRGVDREAEAFGSLRDSIKSKGLLNPISVREKTDEDGTVYYEIRDGLHRYSASCDAGLVEIPVQVVTFNEAETLEAQIVANICKVDTKPVEYTKGLQRMFTLNPTMTLADMAERVNQSPAWVSQRLNLLKLDPEVQKLVDDGKINVVNAHSLSKLPKEEQFNFLDSAMAMPSSEFGPTVNKRVKELREAARQGREAAGPAEFIPVARARNLGEVKAENDNATAGPAIVAQKGLTTAAEGFAAGVKWALCLDDASVASSKAKHDARIAKQAEEKKKRELERAEKKEKEAAEAAAKARAAAGA